jgi:hypothetical protein
MKRIFLLAGLALVFSSCFPVYRTVRPEPVVSGSGFVPVSPAPQPVPVQEPVPVVSGGVVIYVSGGIQVSRIIGDFQPTKGEGATYINGERLVLRADVAYPGYMTLLIYNPAQWDNSVLTNIPVRAGLNLISQVPGGELSVAPPFGTTRIRAIFTPRPIALGSYRWVSAQSLNNLTRQLLNPYNVGERDFAETFVTVIQ